MGSVRKWRSWDSDPDLCDPTARVLFHTSVLSLETGKPGTRLVLSPRGGPEFWQRQK